MQFEAFPNTKNILMSLTIIKKTGTGKLAKQFSSISEAAV